MNIGHAILFSLLIWITIWAFFGWAGVLVTVVVSVLGTGATLYAVSK